MNSFSYSPQYNVSELKELAGNFSVNNLLKHYAYQNKALNFEQAYLLGIFTLAPYKERLAGLFNLDKKIIEIQSITALSSLHNISTYKHINAPHQIAGICAAIFDYDIRLSKEGFVVANKNNIMDNGIYRYN
jgi:hypothetical protein